MNITGLIGVLVVVVISMLVIDIIRYGRRKKTLESQFSSLQANTAVDSTYVKEADDIPITLTDSIKGELGLDSNPSISITESDAVIDDEEWEDGNGSDELDDNLEISLYAKKLLDLVARWRGKMHGTPQGKENDTYSKGVEECMNELVRVISRLG